MKLTKPFIAITILTICCGTTFSQVTDSLSVSPNPFNSSTTIHFDIVQSDTITLRVFNSFGQNVKTFFLATILSSGSYSINLLGDTLANGVYFIRLEIGSKKSITKKGVKSGSTFGLPDNKETVNSIIFPNPTSDQITIPLDGSKTIIVTDMSGKTIQSFKTDEQVISLSDIASGQYFITILKNGNEIIATQKILKIR